MATFFASILRKLLSIYQKADETCTFNKDSMYTCQTCIIPNNPVNCHRYILSFVLMVVNIQMDAWQEAWLDIQNDTFQISL